MAICRKYWGTSHFSPSRLLQSSFIPSRGLSRESG